MKKIICSFLAALFLLASLSGCGADEGEANRLTVVATTYPVYLLACAVTDGVEGVSVERLNTGSVSCLHDYTLSVDDMKKLEGADVIALNGAGLEDFMEDALAASDAASIDCSAGVELLENLSHSHEEGDRGRPRSRPLGPPYLDGPRKRRRNGRESGAGPVPGPTRTAKPGTRRMARPPQSGCAPGRTS